MTVIALCPQNSIFWSDKLLDREFVAQYPGGGWIQHFEALARTAGHRVHTGDQVELMIKRREVSPRDVVVYQEEDSTLAVNLTALGAARAVIVSFESPLFAGRFYRDLPSLSSGFDHAVLFEGAHHHVAPGVVPHTAYFPSFTPGELWQMDREPTSRIALIAGNKYWRPTGWSPRSLARRLRASLRGPIYTKDAARMQLHDFRLDFIEYFGDRGLDLFGPGWSSLSRLPKDRRPGLKTAASRAKPVPYRKKVESLACYRFAACIENVMFPGYVTEKIIDALVAGTVPLYMGAPDVTDFMPESAFIDMRRFGSMAELDDFLDDMDGATWRRYRDAGRAFLLSDEGSQFSNPQYARRVMDLVLSC